MLARGAPEAILPPLIIGMAVIFGGAFAHIAIGKVMSPEGADIILFVLTIPGTMLLIAALFLLWFYRDPQRTPQGPIVSAADGRVVLVEKVRDADIGDGHRIAVFMSPLDVHVNRVPVSAELRALTHHAGGFVPAFRKDSEQNERLITIWQTTGDKGIGPGQTIKIVQIAGAMARRIVPWTEQGEARQRGERFGMIKLGSRVDVYLPQPYTPVVKVGDRVRAGETPIAEA